MSQRHNNTRLVRQLEDAVTSIAEGSGRLGG